MGRRIVHPRDVLRAQSRTRRRIEDRSPHRSSRIAPTTAKASTQAHLEAIGEVSAARRLFDGPRLRTLTLVDNYTCECLAIDVGPGLMCEDVVRALTRITASRRKPRPIKSGNGSEFISKRGSLGARERHKGAVRGVRAMPVQQTARPSCHRAPRTTRKRARPE